MQYQFPAFENLCPSWRRALHLGIRRTIPKGTFIFGLGEPIEGVYWIVEGVVDVLLYTHQGPEKILFSVGPGCAFGIASCFLTRESGEASARARTDLTLYFFPRELLEGQIAREDPALLIELLQVLSHIVRMHGVLIRDSLSLDYFERVCRFLVYLVRYKHPALTSDQKEVTIDPGVSQSDLAKLLGMHRVTVAKAIQSLKERGVIRRFTKSALDIADLPRLHLLSNEAAADPTGG